MDIIFNEKGAILDAKLNFQDFYFTCTNMYRGCVYLSAGLWGLEGEPDLPELELPNAGTGNWTQVTRKAASTINHQAISPAP